MTDEKGGDEKVIAVPSDQVTARHTRIKSYRDLPDILVQQIAHFFEHYKDLEKSKWVRIDEWGDADDAREMIARAIASSAK
jgi:inorganic pyrophosphatase